jgi:hypothetical protein
VNQYVEDVVTMIDTKLQADVSEQRVGEVEAFQSALVKK